MNALLRFMTEQFWAMEPGVLQAATVVLERHLAGVELSREQIDAITARRDEIRSHRMAFLAAAAATPGGKKPTCESYRVGSVAVIPIEGMLANHASMINDISQPEGMLHADIQGQVEAATGNAAVRSIMLAIGSAGGTVQGTPSLAAAVRAAAMVKPVVAVSMGIMASAAYWIGSQADEIYCDSPTDQVGSIGAYAVATDTTQALANQGIRKILVKAGEYKAGLVPGLPVNDAAVSEMEQQLAEILRVFSGEVAAARGMSPQKATSVSNGRVYIGQQAVDAGLVDGIRSASDVLAYMEKEFGTPTSSAPTTKRGFSAAAQQRISAMSKETPTNPTNPTPTNPSTPAAPVIEAKAPAVEAAKVPAGTPATFAELHAAFGAKPGGSDVIVEAQAKGLTIVAAYGLYTEKLEAQVAAAAKEPQKNPATPPTPAALAPVATFTANAPGGQAPGGEGEPKDFAAAVALVLKRDAADFKGRNPAQAQAMASARAAKAYPQLHAAWREADFPALKIA